MKYEIRRLEKLKSEFIYKLLHVKNAGEQAMYQFRIAQIKMLIMKNEHKNHG